MSRLTYKLKAFCTLIAFFHILTFDTFAQEYGLEFLGHEVVTDKRTTLMLGNEASICPKNSFSLSFELKFKPKVSSYFGYVFRIITEDNKNIDLLFQSDSKGKQQNFRIISGDKDIKLNQQLDSVSLYTKWSQFNIKIEKSQIQIFCNNQLLGSGNIPFEFKQCFKAYFGECSNPKFLTSDGLPMYLRNVILKSGTETTHHWPLKEIFGNETFDIIGGQKAITKNAQWLLRKHYEWKQLTQIKVKGNVSFSFDSKQQKFIINTDQKTFFYKTLNDSLTSRDFNQKHKKFTFGDLGLFLTTQNKQVNIRLNEKKIFGYNPTNNTWDISPNEKYNLTEFWHHNKYVYPNDSALALIGGYGQYKYKNIIQKYSFQTNTWSNLNLKGDVIEPRYMFGLGNKNATKSYLFGGFGSKTGDQGLNPQNYYDLFEIDWKTNSARKVYDLTTPESPFAVASSLIIKQEGDSFYGLIYNQLKFNSSLQLIEGSLSKPEIKPIAKEIPYKFLDVASTADLFFDEANSKLFCVTSFHERPPADSTEVTIYSLDFPPSNLPIVNKAKSSFFQRFGKALLYIVPFLIVLLMVSLALIRKKRKKPEPQFAPRIDEEKLSEIQPVIESLPAIVTHEEPIHKGQILLFGGFQFLNAQGQNITNQFTPLLKEMFLYLLLHSIKWGKGVNSAQLNEMFWFDKTTNSARNNRSVNITKLKSIFEQLPSIEITKDTGNWKIIFDPNFVYVDYYEFQKLTTTKKTLNTEQINTLTEIINRGSFLLNTEYEWLDDFKGEISNKVIDSYLAYSKKLTINDNADEIVEIADNIFKFDSVDEIAMSLKCRALVHLGKHTLAKSTYEKFAKDYQRLYSEEYSISYKQILES